VSAATAALAYFRKRLRAAGSPARAVGTKKYLKSDLRFYGTSQPDLRDAVREFGRDHPDLSRAELRALAQTLYATNVHELRAAAIGVLEQQRGRLTDRDLPWLIDLARRSKSWAYVDWLAPKVIGDILERHPPARRVLGRWARDESFWVRRTALLAQHDQLRAGRGDFPYFARLAGLMVDEREFFIRKAIGWVLREVSKKRPALVFEFLREHRSCVSSLSLREGAKYLPAAQRRALGLPASSARAARQAAPVRPDEVSGGSGRSRTRMRARSRP
jgi:3-methyladenine DNA glycosylase AlkD